MEKYKPTNSTYGLDAMLKADEKTVEDEVMSIEYQIAERERIKRTRLEKIRGNAI